MLDWIRVTSLYGKAVSLNRKGRQEEALDVLLRAAEVLTNPSINPASSWVLTKHMWISIFIYRLAEQLGRPGLEREAVRNAYKVWEVNVKARPGIRSLEGFAEWETWARSYVNE